MMVPRSDSHVASSFTSVVDRSTEEEFVSADASILKSVKA
jgi:hypothetical protein